MEAIFLGTVPYIVHVTKRIAESRKYVHVLFVVTLSETTHYFEKGIKNATTVLSKVMK